MQFASKALPDRFPFRVGPVHLAYEGTLNGERTVYDPRPFDPAMHNEPNPVLTVFREDVKLYPSPEDAVRGWLQAWTALTVYGPRVSRCSFAQQDHAHRVLSRLERLGGIQ